MTSTCRFCFLAVSLALAACASAPPKAKFQMRTYGFVLLRRGPAWTPEKTPETQRIFEGHMANIKAMGKARKLLIAGPFDDHGKNELAGIFIFDITDEAEIRSLIANDPAISSGRFIADIVQWYGPAGLTFDGREEVLAQP
jgi:uncharacterized protein YciI